MSSSSALSNRESEALLKETKAEALKKCDALVREFAECSTGRTVSIAWACRGQHKALQNCLKQYTSEEAMDIKRREYLAANRKQA
ncbi:hypothetical protein FA09DRAFT_330090 [Tilletiopsis washingtonensis]|uniref:COX assembly mitochondrial protein n=1 Tax=Tilletiopsis washingtonensis TaxID=58919 RepID=A0A316Z9G5_9BASI|nr:hypothetical protein FA09DRAFT_330090 [Tilletiopsis washingtonensis]PWN97926.1 hypothetical protein FA09DRAFT_330090 [Tilletiopsis washingtonensis]